MVDLKLKIRTIPDFPKPGIQFRDITTLLADPQAFNCSGAIRKALPRRINRFGG